MTSLSLGMGKRRRRDRAFRVPHVAPLVRIAATLIAFVLGVAGFQAAYGAIGTHRTLYADALGSLQLIVGSFPSDLSDRDLPWTLTVARWALPLLTAWTTLALAWMQVRNPLRLAKFRLGGDHLVIAGDDNLARQMASAERDQGRRVLLWSGDYSPPWIDDALNRGAARLSADGDDAGTDRLGLDKARGVLLLAPDDSGNTALIAKIIAEAGQSRPSGDPLNVIARVDNLELRQHVEARFELTERAPARVRLVSLSDIAARELFVDHPLDGFQWDDDTSRRILALGYSPVVERYILRLLAGGHFRNGVRPQVIVIDPASAACEAAFRAAHPGADALSPVIFEQGVVCQASQGSRAAADAIERHGRPISIVIDCGDDAASLALAMAIDVQNARDDKVSPPIYVHASSHASEHLSATIRSFGGFDRIASPELLLQERHDLLARSIHDFYLEGRLSEGDKIGTRASMREWEDLPESFRDDNRLVADCYQIKLRDIGARVVAGSGPSLRLGDDELEELSRAEHDRWMAAKLATGWRFGSKRDDRARIHPDIKAYDALSEAIKDLDREQIRAMTRMLGTAELRALRTLSVVIEPGGEAGFAAAMPELLRKLGELYPDRIALLTGTIDDSASRDALLAGARQGYPVRLLVACNPQRIVDQLPHGEREAVSQLIHDADTLVALSNPANMERVARQGMDLLIAANPVAAAGCPVVVVDAGGNIVSAPWQK